VAAVEGHELTLTKSFGGGDHRGVDRSQRQVSVGARQFSDPNPVGRENRFGDQVPGGEITEEPNLRFWTEPGPEQIHDLGNDEDGNDQRAGMGLQDLEAFPVMPVITVDVGIEGPGIDDEGDQATSARRIRSICSDTSDRPLLPAPAAKRRRRPRPPPPR